MPNDYSSDKTEVLSEHVPPYLIEKTIMMVDDDLITMDLIQTFLEDFGFYKFIKVENSAMAMKVMTEAAPDILLLDLMMPGISGFDVLLEVRRHPVLKSLPVIILTAAADSGNKHRALALGATDFLAKPVDSSELALRVRNTLAVKAQQDELLAINKQLEEEIHERQMAEAALHESEKRFIDIISGSEDAILLSNGSRFTECNEAAIMLLGFGSKEKLLAAAPATLSAQDTIQYLIKDAFEHGTVFQELVCRKADGEEFPANISISTILFQGKHILYMILKDITEQKKIEQIKEDVAAMTRHDLKNPLGAIIGIVDFMKSNSKLTKEEDDDFTMIRDCGYRMLSMINLSLDLYKMEKGSYIPNFEEVDILAVLIGIITEFAGEIKHNKLQVKLLLDERKPQEDDLFLVNAEKLLCYTMFANLIRNGIEASPEGGSLTISLGSESNASYIRIHNQGEVSEKIVDTFFDKYVTTGKKEGTGLGTYSAKLFAETQNASIDMTTSADHGTTVTILFPG